MFEVNWLAIVLAALAGFVVGGIWYGPVTGKKWTGAVGLTEEQIKQGNMGMIYGGAFLFSLLASWTLAREYGFTDIDGRRPDWWAFLEQSIDDLRARGGPESDEEKYWVQAWHTQLKDQPEHQALVNRIAELLP